MGNTLPHIPKLLTLEQAKAKRDELKRNGKSLALTNGCFDILHAGHFHSLNQAAKCGDVLWVALNSDTSIKKLKGNARPIQTQWERAYALSSLESVGGVILFDTERLVTEIEILRPDAYVKAGDYSLESMNQQERRALESAGTQISFLDFLEGFSTTKLIDKLQSS